MELKVIRKIFTETSTVGELHLNGNFICYTKEDRDRNLDSTMNEAQIAALKVPCQTAVPYGRYRVALTFSSRFHKLMPQVLDVRGFAGVRIHNGISGTAMDGGLLLGKTKRSDFVGMSRSAFSGFLSVIQRTQKTEPVSIEYIKE